MTLLKLNGSQSEAKRRECEKGTGGVYKSGREIKRVGKRVTRMFEIVPKFSEIYQRERGGREEKKGTTFPFPSSKG